MCFYSLRNKERVTRWGNQKCRIRVLIYRVKAVLFISQNSKGKSQSREVRGFVFRVSVSFCMCVWRVGGERIAQDDECLMEMHVNTENIF